MLLRDLACEREPRERFQRLFRRAGKRDRPSRANLLNGGDDSSAGQRAAALNRAGFEVFSTSIENHARTQIETGRRGVLLICFRISLRQANELASLFRRNCPDGQVIFIVKDTHDLAADADAFIPDSKGPQAIVQVLRSGQQKALTSERSAM